MPWRAEMTKELQDLIDRARKVPESAADREQQRRSFAYGNTAIENKLITREMVDRQAERLKSEPKAKTANG